MEIGNQKAYNWLVKYLSKETGLNEKKIKKVLGAISDLSWNYMKTKYDLYGLELEKMMIDLGSDRNPDPEKNHQM